MSEETWLSRALPILEYISTKSESELISIGEIADETGVAASDAVSEVERLIGARYISGKVVKMMTGGDVRPWFIEGAGIAERGARAIGMWPSDDIFGDFLKYLDSSIEASTDEMEKTRLQKLRTALFEIGSSVGTSLLSAWLQSVAGLH
jgi:hypothetical protein